MKILTILFLAISLSITAQDRQSDSLALVAIYNDMGGPSWTGVDHWLSDMPLEDWTGINIQNDRVVTLSLRNNNIAGVFSSGILDLTELTSLELNNGSIPHPIPDRLTDLTKLNSLILQNLELTGNIPTDLNKLATIRTLSLSRNNLTGTLPDLLPAAITSLNFGRNELSGSIPAAWTGLALNTFRIDDNMLTGSFDIIQTMAGINTIDISDNDWDEATFPLWVDDLTNLRWFACKNCNLSGPLPETLDFTALTAYSRMLIGSNELYGDASLLFSGAASTADMYLSIRDNPFSGEFPTQDVLQASRIDLWGCNYTSIAPITEGVVIENFDLVRNRLTYSALENVREHILADSLIGISYQSQQDLLSTDTITVTEPTTVIISAGEDLTGTTYTWYKNNQVIENETSATLSIDVLSNENTATYYCRMTHPDYPALQLRRATVQLVTDISTSTTDLQQTRLSIYPTITADDIRINNPLSLKITKMQLIGINGSHYATIQMQSDGSIDLSRYPSGTYILSIHTESSIDNLKFIKH